MSTFPDRKVLVIAIVAFALNAVELVSSSAIKEAPVLAPGLQVVNLGYVEGKYFIADNYTGNWNNAAYQCTRQGFRMAEITSVVQLEFLKSKYDRFNFEGGYWVAGRDALNVDQFVWDGSGTSFKSSNISPSRVIYPQVPSTCLEYVASNSIWENGMINTHEFSVTQRKTLCEL